VDADGDKRFRADRVDVDGLEREVVADGRDLEPVRGRDAEQVRGVSPRKDRRVAGGLAGATMSNAPILSADSATRTTPLSVATYASVRPAVPAYTRFSSIEMSSSAGAIIGRSAGVP